LRALIQLIFKMILQQLPTNRVRGQEFNWHICWTY